MTGRSYERDDDETLAQAGDWIARLQADDVTAADAEAFDAWLTASPAHGPAYDKALGVWLEFSGAAGPVIDTLQARGRRPLVHRRWMFAAGGLAAAAAVAAAVLPSFLTTPDAETYATAKGEHRTVRLDDGSRVDLNADTRLQVTFARDGRRVVMGEGEAVFDVAHDARRPFTIAAASHVVQVLGTQFDVRNRGKELAVAVTRGVVQVRGEGGESYVLRRGQRLDIAASGEARVRIVGDEEALGWRNGRVVYRAEPLSHVVDDLNRQFAKPIAIADPELAALQVSGVLVIDDQAAVLERLTLMLPITAIPSDEGVMLARR